MESEDCRKDTLWNGCPTCAGLRLKPGLNDLKTKSLVAEEADGWDPSQITYERRKKSMDMQ